MNNRFYILLVSTLISSITSAQTYTYDELGRVKTEIYADKTTTYTYDAADNRTSTTTEGINTNTPPKCNNGVVNMNSVPPIASPVNIKLVSSTFLSYCSDGDGDTLTLKSPVTPYSFAIASGQSKVITFKVTDGKSPEVSATLTYTRP